MCIKDKQGHSLREAVYPNKNETYNLRTFSECFSECFSQVTYSRLLTFLSLFSVIVMRFSAQGPKGREVRKWLRGGGHLLLFPVRLKKKNLSVCRLSPLELPFSSAHSLQSQEECCIKSAQQWQQKHQQKPKGQTRLSFLPWTHNAPSYPPFQPSPCPPAKPGMLGLQWPFHPKVPPWFLRKIRRW